MISATITASGWNVRLYENPVHLVDVVEGQPVEKNLSEAFRLHSCLSWIFKSLMDCGFVVEDHEITVEASEKLKPFLCGRKIPTSKAGSELVSKSRMILSRFKRHEIL